MFYNSLQRIIFMSACMASANAVWTVAHADGQEQDRQFAVNQWQQNLVFAPSQSQLARESKGGITIVSGFRDTEVDHAMDEQFERIENLMFVGTVVTNNDGSAAIDPGTGQPETEDDGC